MDEHDRYEAGLEVRREVLGDAHVQRSLSNRTALNTDFQDLITRYAWGEIWTRDGLPRHTRSLITIGLMVALNRQEELALHLNAAKNNGVSPEEIKEVLLQTAIYCGVPAANSAFHLFDRLFASGQCRLARSASASLRRIAGMLALVRQKAARQRAFREYANGKKGSN